MTVRCTLCGSSLVAWLRREGVHVISAAIHPRHAASQKVAARAGLEPTDATEDGEQIWRVPGVAARTPRFG